MACEQAGGQGRLRWSDAGVERIQVCMLLERNIVQYIIRSPFVMSNITRWER